ncbi:odorant receptor 131-2-like [Anguilla anguilla]|uniref:odorant receptor 131-2-like n=1 Tax=Anguilla anguilla TaxID=7936 RepID=UPI0015AB348B|nr:odorant receptor 131-2-like [Anguilla anguilla]
MNSTWDRMDSFQEAFIKNFILVFLGIAINYVNGTFVAIFFTNQIFYTESRYILYINMVINDMIMLSLTVAIHVATYISPLFKMPVCCVVIIIGSTTHKNTPLNLAGMAIERYIAVCNPLRHAEVCTIRRTYIALAITWGVAAVPALSDLVITLVTQPFSFFSKALLCYSFNVYNTRHHVDSVTPVLVIYLSFVWLTLVYTYFRVLFAAKAASTDPISARRARNTILLHGAQLMLCMLSYIAPWCDMFFLQLFPNHRTKILFATFVISNVLPRLLSPLIYGIRDQKLFKCMKGYYCAAEIQ